MAPPTPWLTSSVITSARGSPTARAASAVSSGLASSTTMMWSTSSGDVRMTRADQALLVVGRHDDRDPQVSVHAAPWLLAIDSERLTGSGAYPQ